PAFARGEATTSFIGQHRDTLLAPSVHDSEELALAALLLYVTHPYAPPWRRGRSLAAGFPTPVRFRLDQKTYDVDVGREREGSCYVRLENELYRVEIDDVGTETVCVTRNGRKQSFKWSRERDRLFLLRNGRTLCILDLTLAAPEQAA